MWPKFIRDVFGIWHDTRLIVLVAQTAAVYAAILIPFKMGIPLIPGYSELRPANAIPLVASLLFGPAAAWGSGFGNVIGDCFGTLGPGSIFGFFGNFCYAYVPYLLWGRLGPLSSGKEPVPRSPGQILELAIIGLIASAICAAIIAWGVDFLGLLPFRLLAPAIFFNNALMSLLLAPPLLLFLYPRVKRWGLRYGDIVSTKGQTLHGSGLTNRCEERASLLRPSPPGKPETIVEAIDVRFTYDAAPAPALDGLSLTIQRGQSVMIMGRSGAGKSTLCYALNGLVPRLLSGRWSGRLLVDGHDTLARPVWQQAESVGLVFQDFEAQLVSTNVEREVAFPLEHRSHHHATSDRLLRVRAALARVGLSGLERRHPLSLSGGQRQRLVIASTLIRQPALVAMDEPATDLDPAGRRDLATLLASLKADGHSLIVADHDPEEAVTADRLCILDQGRLVWEGSPGCFFGNADHHMLARQFGLRPLPLAECFTDRGLARLPVTVEEAWAVADDHGWHVSGPPAQPADHASGRPILNVRRASYLYPDGTPAIADIDLTIREGEFIALVGRNGCGKTTLASLLNGLRLPTQGSVLVNDRETHRLNAAELAAAIGFVFQNPDHQIFAETVEDEVAFAVKNLGYTAESCKQRIAAALYAVGLDAPHIRTLDPFSLTKGERQRVAVASVLAASPRTLIFDEPTTGLDAEEISRMMGMIDRLNQEGHTIIMITHALGLVAAHARRCVVMHEGRVAVDGPTRSVFQRLLDPGEAARLGLEVPPITRFAARWDATLLTVAEVKAALSARQAC